MASGAIELLSLILSLTTSTALQPLPAAPAEDPAPDFEIATAYGWHHFHELHGESPVLLVFEADAGTLAALEARRDELASRGVEIVAVTRQPDGANWDLLEALGLRYRLLSDPAGHVADLFGLTNPALPQPVPAWCLVERGGRIAEIHRGIQVDLLAEDVEEMLGKPAAPEAAGDAMR